MKPKLLIILGPTASGKSDMAVKLAKRFNGEVISADSRQVYRGLNVGTGKITRAEMKGVRHHLLDVIDPKRQFTAERFKKLADKAIRDIQKRSKLPIICGGTGFYIDVITNRLELPAVGIDLRLRKKLANKTAGQLLSILERLDSERAQRLNDSDRKNPRRLIRAIEIARAQNEIGKSDLQIREVGPPENLIFIGINPSKDILKERIHVRLLKRLNQKDNLIQEARKLHTKGLSWKRMEELGLEYRYLARYLQGKMTREEMIERLEIEIWHYAKRQLTWFKRNKEIRWFESATVAANAIRL